MIAVDPIEVNHTVASCTPASEATEGVLTFSQPSPQSARKAGLSGAAVEFHGLIPDGANTATFTTATGATTMVSAVNNGISAVLTAEPTAERFTSGGVTHVVSIAPLVDKGAQR